jgi:hypothetical protein
MEHTHYAGQKNTPEVVKDKAWYFASLIAPGLVQMYKNILERIKNDSDYGVRMFNEKRLGDAQIEDEILLISLAKMRASKHLDTSLAELFYGELVTKAAEIERAVAKEESDEFVPRYKELCQDRIYWHDNSNQETKVQGVPSGDTHKINCINLFAKTSDRLTRLFETEFTNLYINLNIDGLLAE